MGKLILASGSKNRQEALTIAQIPFTATPADIDEKEVKAANIKKRVVKIAQAKVHAVAKENQGVILGADGMNVVGDQVLGKPKTRSEALEMIKLQSNQTCSFLTGWCILNTKTEDEYSGVTESHYRFRKLDQHEIEQYIDSVDVYQYAAAFSPINTMAIRFVAWVKGSPSQFNFSMPLETVLPILKNQNIEM